MGNIPMNTLYIFEYFYSKQSINGRMFESIKIIY